MGNGSQHPSVYEKIHGKFYRISRLFSDITLHKTKCGPLTTTKNVSPGFFFQSLRQSSTTVQPNARAISVESPLDKGANGLLSLHLAGTVTRTAVAPLERVKLLIQSQKTGRLSEPYKGITHCFARTTKNEGFCFLWRGSTANIIRSVILMGLDHQYCKENFKRLFTFTVNKDKGYDHYWNWFARKMASFVYSLDYAYTRLANDVKAAAAALFTSSKCHGKRQFKGLIDVYKKTLKTDGIPGCIVDSMSLASELIVYRGLDVVAYESLPVGNLQDHFLARVMVKYGVILGSTLACYPFDTVRRRMMMTSGEAIKYKNSWDAFNQIIKNEGAKSLYKGFGARILHTSAVTVAFMVYGLLQTLLLLKHIGRGSSEY